MKPHVLIITGDGINCEQETARAFAAAGAVSNIVHAETLLNQPELLKTHQILVFPGGFAYGDELGSGKVLGLKLENKLQEPIREFLAKNGLILGICNGFQMLVKMGLLPFADFQFKVTLTHNSKDAAPFGFQDRHVTMKVNPSPSVWLKGLEGHELRVPIRHGEGRLLIRDSETEKQLTAQKLNCLTYTENVNGSWQNCAGLTDPSGRILGLMPHPEVFFSEDSIFTANQKIFKNAVEAANL